MLPPGSVPVPKEPKNDPLRQIEENQKQLLDNINKSKQLVDDTQELLKKAKQDRPPS